MSRLLLGCVADAFTGATDLANDLVRACMRVVQSIGAPIDPGVPWCFADADAAATGGEGLHVALKSGNFGDEDFFNRAFEVLA